MSEEAKVAIARARSAAKIAQAEAAAKIAEAEAKGANASSVSSTPDSQIGSYNFFTKTISHCFIMNLWIYRNSCWTKQPVYDCNYNQRRRNH